LSAIPQMILEREYVRNAAIPTLWTFYFTNLFSRNDTVPSSGNRRRGSVPLQKGAPVGHPLSRCFIVLHEMRYGEGGREKCLFAVSLSFRARANGDKRKKAHSPNWNARPFCSQVTGGAYTCHLFAQFRLQSPGKNLCASLNRHPCLFRPWILYSDIDFPLFNNAIVIATQSPGNGAHFHRTSRRWCFRE